MDTRRIFIFLLIISVTNVATAEMYKWVDENGNISFSDRPQPGLKSNVIQLSPKPLTKPKSIQHPNVVKGTTVNKKPSTREKKADVGAEHEPITLKVRNLLFRRRYDELNSLLKSYEKAAEENVEKEEDLFTAYFVFYVGDEGYGLMLNEWVKATPDAYQPYMARAEFYSMMGWDARGTKWASETTNEQINRMNSFFTKASQDMELVLNTKKCIRCYRQQQR